MNKQRSKKAETALFKALVQQLHKKSLNKITIKSLTEEANLHRTTFYANYNDIQELYNESESTVFKELMDHFTTSSELYDFYYSLLTYVDNNRLVCGLFFDGKIPQERINVLSSLFVDPYISSLRKAYGVTAADEEIMDIVLPFAQYHFAGCVTMVGQWVDQTLLLTIDELATRMANMELSLGKVVVAELQAKLNEV